MCRQSRQTGFTLIEIVAVIVILGILATASTKLIVFGTQVYVETNDRMQVLSRSRFLVERLSRELKTAIPNSILATTNCIQFIPIKSSGAYREDASATTPPIFPVSGDTLDVVSWTDISNYNLDDRLYIYATEEAHLYSDTTHFMVIANAVVSSGNEYQITFNAIDSFEQGSPRQRYYTADSSVSFCLWAGNVYRNETTGIPASPPVIDSDDDLDASWILMSEGLTNDIAQEPPFRYEPGTLYRNSVVNLYLEFNANSDENMFFNQEVHIPNVP